MSEPESLVERLREGFQGDHDRGCEGRQYTCSCGYDERFHLAAEEAAAELSTLRSRCETLEKSGRIAIDAGEEMIKTLTGERDEARAARDEAVRALEPFAKHCAAEFNDWCPDEIPAFYISKDGFDEPTILTVGDFRRARALAGNAE